MYKYKNLKYIKNNFQFGGAASGGGASGGVVSGGGASGGAASGGSLSSVPSLTGEDIYQTEIIDPSIKRIITLSDIHADIHSFIIALRDCAQVIRKKPGFAFDQNTRDIDLETLLQKDLNDAASEAEYFEDLNYEWIENNTYVVIIGDILDGVRPNLNIDASWYLKYPQLEIKLLLFINKLDDLAKTKNSRVIKILGNHEFMNMSYEDSVWLNRMDFNFPEDYGVPLKNYYKGDNRVSSFMANSLGYKLLMKNGNGVLVKINNNIFVHGSLESGKTLKDYDNINKILNNPATPLELLLITIDNYTGYKGVGYDSMVWERRYGKIEDIDERITINKKHDLDLDEDDFEKLRHCTSIKNDLKKLTGLEDITNLRVFVGHCIQSLSTINNIQNTTFTRFNNVPAKPFIEIIEPPARSALSDPDTNFLFGITMECQKTPENINHYLYHVDIGSSRAFDNNAMKTIQNKREEKKHLLSRSPQVMEIYNNDTNVRIIRSTIKNTRIHLLRNFYEEHANTIPDINLASYNKYLKYKNKYLKLKNISI